LKNLKLRIGRDNLPQLPMSPKVNGRFILSPKRPELDSKQELIKSSQMLRHEDSFTSQSYGIGFMPNSYGGKSYMDFLSHNSTHDNVFLLSSYLL
jgi:hypothetical protein